MATDISLNDLDVYTVNYYLLIPAVFIILFLSFLEKRKSHHDCCGGRPALIIPFHFLDGSDNRTAYAMAFGTATNTVVSLIMSQQTLGFDVPLWAQFLYVYLQATIGCLICFPLFACLTTRYRAVGAILCILYSGVRLSLETVIMIQKTDDCINTTTIADIVNDKVATNIARACQVMIRLPIIFCYLILIGYCVYILVRCYQNKTYFSKRLESTIKFHQEDHVRWVLRGFKVKHIPGLSPTAVSIINGDSSTEKFITRMEKCVRLRYFVNFPFFKYPTKMFVTAFVMINVMYLIGIIFIMPIIEHLYELRKVFPLAKSIDLYATIVISSIIITLVNCVLQVFLGIRQYRCHMLKIYQGDRSFIPNLTESSQYILTMSMLFPGYQIAFMLWGFFLCFDFVLITLCIIALPIYIYAKLDLLGKLVSFLAQILVFPAATFLIFYLQVFMTKRVLLQDKVKPTDKHPPMNVDNRKFYEIVNYYSLFTNMAVGLFTCLWRIVGSVSFGVCTVGRIDRSVFTRDLEHIDKGYKAYISMLLVDNAHNNPCMRVFAHLLWTKILSARFSRKRNNSETVSDTTDLVSGTPTDGSRQYNEDPSNTQGNAWVFCESSDAASSRQCRNRWHLAYTLVNNPQLCFFRKHYLNRTDRTASVVSSIKKFEYEKLRSKSSDCNNLASASARGNTESCTFSDTSLVVSNRTQSCLPTNVCKHDDDDDDCDNGMNDFIEDRAFRLRATDEITFEISTTRDVSTTEV